MSSFDLRDNDFCSLSLARFTRMVLSATVSGYGAVDRKLGVEITSLQ